MKNQVLTNVYKVLFSLMLCLYPGFFLYPATFMVNPGESIQKAINLSRDGDIIIVFPGIYTENLKIKGKNIVLRSGYPDNPGAVAATIIDGGRKNPVITFKGNEKRTCIIAGLTLINGTGVRGGGIAGNKTRATISENVIMNNSAFTGAGIYGVSGNIVKNVIKKNTAFAKGGGIAGSHGIISGNLITENTAACFEGGGLFFCNGTLKNNVIYANSASRWGGALSSCNARIFNNTITANTAGLSGGGLYGCLRAKIKNCIFRGNTAKHSAQLSHSAKPAFCCIEGWPADRMGNINADPLFVNQADGDFRLKQESPCIDAGCFIKNLTADFLGNPRPPRGSGNRFDIGAFEFTGWIKPVPPAGLTVEYTGGFIILAWDAAPGSGTAGYNVYRRQEANTSYTQLNTEPVPAAVYRDLPLPGGGIVHYVVTAVDQYGNESAYSTPVSIKLEPRTIFTGGTLFYTGGQAGIIHVMLMAAPGSPEPAFSLILEKPGAYGFQDIPAARTFWITAYIDVNANQLYEAWEPYGACEKNPVHSESDTFDLDINCYDPDTDQDTLPDYWELQYAGNLDMTAYDDPDADDLDNYSEYLAGTNPGKPDTDTDGIPDGGEVALYGTNPLNSDTDGDGWSDSREVYQTGTNPLSADTDDDGITDKLDPFPFIPAAGSPPVITITTPAAGEKINTTAIITAGTIACDTPVSEVRVNSVLAAYADGSFSCTIKLPEGVHSITVRAVSIEGYVTTEKIEVTVDALPPRITILTPADNAQIREQNVWVMVQADDPGLVITINGQAAARNGFLYYRWVELPAPEMNSITAETSASAGAAAAAIDVVFNPYEGYAADDDADQDGAINCKDLFPYDPLEATDADHDGIGSSQDPDDTDPAIQGVIQILSPLPGAVLYDSQYQTGIKSEGEKL